MIVLTLIAIYIYHRFANLAVLKGRSKGSWATAGITMYLVVSIGMQLVFRVLFVRELELLMEFDVFIYGGDFVAYVFGGFSTYLLFRHYKKQPSLIDEDDLLNQFGKKEKESDFE